MKAAAILAVVLLIGVLSVQGDWKKPPFNKCWWKLKWCLKKCHIWPFPWNCQKLCYWKYKKCIWLGGHHFGGGYGDYGPGLGGLGDGGMGGGGMSGGGGFDGYDDDDSYGGYGWHRPIQRKKKY
uniref:Lysine-rich matrix protein 10 n=1 Tax=Pinctada fucata TaxID=50426 RepID=A0A1B0UKL8_PINFU|nr:lysine-rich matrix protein 10 [Pinctada fucata]